MYLMLSWDITPNTNKIAVLIIGQVLCKRDMVPHCSDNKLFRISELHRTYISLEFSNQIN